MKRLILPLVFVSVIFISGCVQQSEERLPTGEAAEAYEEFNLKVGETKSFSLLKHEITVLYLSNSPKQSLEVTVDGEKDKVEIEITDICYTTTTKCETIVPENESEEKKTVCREVQEQSDCSYSWKRGEIVFNINPLIIEQDLDKDGKICEDPFEINGEPICGASFQEGPQIDNDGDGLINEDYQEYYYYRNNWNTNLLEFSIYIPKQCPLGVGCPELVAQ
jgi:hypothetical protein